MSTVGTLAKTGAVIGGIATAGTLGYQYFEESSSSVAGEASTAEKTSYGVAAGATTLGGLVLGAKAYGNVAGSLGLGVMGAVLGVTVAGSIAYGAAGLLTEGDGIKGLFTADE